MGAAVIALLLGGGLDSLAALNALDAPLDEAVARFEAVRSAGDGLAPAAAAAASVPALGLLYLAVANAASAAIQPRAHAAVPPAFSQIFYAQTPLWASVFAFCFLHESFSDTSLMGVGAFTVSLGVAACPDEAFTNAMPTELNVFVERGTVQRNVLATWKQWQKKVSRRSTAALRFAFAGSRGGK